jgi:hypothetical protein
MRQEASGVPRSCAALDYSKLPALPMAKRNVAKRAATTSKGRIILGTNVEAECAFC